MVASCHSISNPGGRSRQRLIRNPRRQPLIGVVPLHSQFNHGEKSARWAPLCGVAIRQQKTTDSLRVPRQSVIASEAGAAAAATPPSAVAANEPAAICINSRRYMRISFAPFALSAQWARTCGNSTRRRLAAGGRDNVRQRLVRSARKARAGRPARV